MANQFVQGLGWLGAAKLAGQLISWGVTLYMFRLLGPADYALVAMCGSVTLLLNMLADFGLGAALVQAKEITDRLLSAVFGAALLLSTALVLGVCLASPAIAAYYRAPELEWLVCIASTQLMAGALLTPVVAKINHASQYRKLAVLDFVQSAFTSGTTLTMGLMGFGVLSVIAGPVLGLFVKALVGHLINRVGVWPSWDFRTATAHIRFGGGLLANGFLAYLANQSYVIVGGRFLSKEEMGYFSVALELAQLPLAKLMVVINQVTYPEVARQRREGKLDSASLLFGFRTLFMVLYPVFLCIGVTASLWVPLVLGEKWLGAIPVLQVFCITMVFQAGASLNSTILLGLGLMRQSLTTSLLYCVITFMAVGVAVEAGTALALALATALAVSAALVFTVQHARGGSGYGVTAFALTALPAVVASGASGVVMAAVLAAGAAWKAWPIALLTGTLATGVLLYALVLWLTAKADLMRLMAMVRNTRS